MNLPPSVTAALYRIFVYILAAAIALTIKIAVDFIIRAIARRFFQANEDAFVAVAAALEGFVDMVMERGIGAVWGFSRHVAIHVLVHLFGGAAIVVVVRCFLMNAVWVGVVGSLVIIGLLTKPLFSSLIANT